MGNINKYNKFMENQLVQALASSFLMKLGGKTLVDGQIASLALAPTKN